MQGGHGTVFGIQVQIAGRIRVSRYKFYRSQKTITVQDLNWGHWSSVAIQTISEPESCHNAGFEIRAGAGVRVVIYKSHVIESSIFKNRDKQMTYIVRVIVRYIIFLLLCLTSM